MAHLYTDQPAPPEWVEYRLVKSFGWTLDQARATPLADGLRLLLMQSEEDKYIVAKSKQHG